MTISRMAWLRKWHVLAVAIVVAMLAGCGEGSKKAAGGKVASQGHAESCLRSRGFTVAEKPDLGAASLPAKGWFSVKRGNNGAAVVAYFSDDRAAGDARKQLLVIAKGTAKALGVKATDAQVNAVLRQTGNVVYFWPGEKPSNLADVQACLRG